MSRKPLIAGNWKMNKTGQEAVETAKELVELTQDVTDVEIMVAPTLLSIPGVAPVLEGTQIGLGAQNLYHKSQGAYTGEVSAEMIQASGAKYVLIGHSERRQLFGETDEEISLKIKAAVDAGLIPVFCIGETEKERDEEKTFLVLDKQVRNGVESSGLNEMRHLVLAYEPVWAIGTGKTASVEQVDEVHTFLRDLLTKLLSKEIADGIRILYGGSVKPANAKELMAIEDVDGALVGGASLEAKTFSEIVRYNK
ncbi:MAG: triose-phosphate isomerase [Desulfobacterales bacterium]|nr:triose-phosphate isomerase [Desulfobacterales bacterium]